MEAYVTAKQMAAHYAMSTDQAYVIMHEMEIKQMPGLLRIGRLLRVRPTEFEAYLIERMKGDPQ